ncbi:MAG: ABC transporter permease [Candidatus Saccharibacteria bacterium]|nr:ABC transporter permease [Candidatus Saccharibacteria bacterium]
MSKTLQVIRFEVVRSLKKPSFWLAALLVPIMLGFYIFIAAMAGYDAGESLEAGIDTSNMTLGIYDEAKCLAIKTFINSKEEKQELKDYPDKQSGINDVQNKKLDVFYYLPKNFDKEHKVEIYVKPKSASVLDDYTNPIRSLLSATALSEVSELNFAIITGAVNFETTTYSAEDNHEVDMNEAVSQIAIPAIGLALFYILIVVLGNRLTAAMVEEKENRISELILTSIKPVNLIVGKIISLMILGIIQLTVLIIPLIVAYFVARSYNAVPFNLALKFDGVLIAEYASLLLFSYFLFTSLCVIIGTMASSAKDANSFMSVIIILTILPIFFISSFTNHEPQAFTYFLSYFPPSAPLALMLRGVFNTLPTWELLLGLVDIIIFGILSSRLATYIFCRNAIAAGPKIDFRKLFGSPRNTWKK